MYSNFNFSYTKSIITYDLENNDISASDIAKQSKHLFTDITVKNKYGLPFSTLGSDYTRDKAIKEFEEALDKAKEEKNSKSKISKLLVVEVDGKEAFVENL